jgi:hypothetical protein
LNSGGFPETDAPAREAIFMVKLCLGGSVLIGRHCSYKTLSPSSRNSVPKEHLALQLHELLVSLDRDSKIHTYAASHPEKWSLLRACLIESALPKTLY